MAVEVKDFTTDGSFSTVDANTINFANLGQTAATITEQSSGSSFTLLAGIRLPLFAFGGLTKTYTVTFDSPTNPGNNVQIIIKT